MAKRYLLRSEIERVKSKKPAWELVLPEVPGEPDPEHPRTKVKPLYEEKVLKIADAAVWDDDVLYLSRTDPVGAAQLLIGSEEDYAHFRAGGGSASILFQIIEEQSGASQGEIGRVHV